MKDLICYINERLVISKNLKKHKEFTIEIPRCYSDDIFSLSVKELKNRDVWKKWNLPKGEFIIYKDCYRNDIPHLAWIGDFLSNVCTAQDDFENFDPKKDILFSSDDQDAIMHWYIEEYLKCPYPQKEDDKYEWIDTCEKIIDNQQNSPIVDSLEVLFDFATHKDEINNGYGLFNFNDPIQSVSDMY